jgi:multiple sugar transport system permease protein
MTRAPVRSHRRGWGRTAVAVAILVVLLFPVYWMVNASLQPSGSLLKASPSWFPTHPTFAGYHEALSSQGAHLLTSVIVALGTVIVSVALALPAAYALAQLRIRGGLIVVFALLVVQMIPGIVMANSLYALYSHLHLIDNYLGLMLADTTATFPFAALILRAFLVGIPPELAEAAQVDGAGHLRTLVSIILPISRNALVTAALFSFLFAWADFLFAVTLTTGQAFEPITVGIYRFIGNQTSDWNGILATSVVASIPAAVLLVLAQRYVSAGITGGAVKD